MRIFSEVVVNDILPVYRSLLSKELKQRGLSQEKIASLISVSQPAVSQYLRGIRGSKSIESNDAVMDIIRNCASKAESNNVYKIDEFKSFCSVVIANKLIPNTSHIEDCNSI